MLGPLGDAIRWATRSRRARQKIARIFDRCPRTSSTGVMGGDGLLHSLCDKWGSDKGSMPTFGDRVYRWPPHTYADLYASLFDHCRQHFKLVFECGLGTSRPEFGNNMGVRGKPGASLRVWRDYFPQATIIGADIDRGSLFEEQRIETYHVDQTNPASIAAMWAQVPHRGFDFILDDGLHTFEAGVTLFEGSFDHVRPGGLYIIEDVSLDSLEKFADYFEEKHYSVELLMLRRAIDPPIDNNVVIIRKNYPPEQ